MFGLSECKRKPSDFQGLLTPITMELGWALVHVHMYVVYNKNAATIQI